MNSKVLDDFDNKDYRDSIVDSYVRNGIAFQIRAMRNARGWDQKKLARLMGNEKLQPLISRYENPDYGRFSVSTILELGRVFDVGVVVRFASWSEIVERDSSFHSYPLNVEDYAAYSATSKSVHVPKPVPPARQQAPPQERRGLYAAGFPSQYGASRNQGDMGLNACVWQAQQVEGSSETFSHLTS